MGCADGYARDCESLTGCIFGLIPLCSRVCCSYLSCVLCVQIFGTWRSRRLVHGDIKPSNIGLDASTKQLFLMDVETIVTVPEGEDSELFEGFYTEQYAAPEVLGESTVNLTSDLYSVGVMLGELVKAKVCTCRYILSHACARVLQRS